MSHTALHPQTIIIFNIEDEVAFRHVTWSLSDNPDVASNEFPKAAIAIGCATVIAAFAAVWDSKVSSGLDQHPWAKPNK